MSEVVTRKGDEGPAYWMLGGLYEVRVSAEETDDRATVMRITVPQGAGSPPHTHPGDETLYVLSGEITVHIGDETVSGGPGSSFFFPAGTKEWFEAQTEAQVLGIYTPGGVDRFFAEVGEMALSRSLPPADSAPPDLERLVAVAAQHGMLIEPPAG
jgi:quercetin dioxygenase-like cupin family protein